MIKKVLSLALVVAIFGAATSCQGSADSQASNKDTTAQVASDSATPSTDSSLVASLAVVSPAASLKDSIIIEFTVHNPTKDTLKFTTYHTPFEGLISKFLDVKDSEGTEVSYQGPMAKRVMPPPADTYHSVAPGASESARFDLKRAYKIDKPGTYTLQYNAAAISGVADGEPIQVTITE